VLIPVSGEMAFASGRKRAVQKGADVLAIRLKSA
jgi:hypothetical protein